MQPTCYACWRPATSDEHVPPRCFFPEAQHAGRDLRRNLITVRACDAHNSAKSKDDEFVRLVLCSAIGANDIGFLQADTSVARSIARRPKLALNMFRGARDGTFTDPATGAELPTKIVPVDGPRFTRAIDLIARGLFLAHFGQKWDREIDIHCDLIGFEDPEFERRQQVVRRHLDEHSPALFASSLLHGENPEVFCYRAARERDGHRALQLRFYGGCRLTALFAPEGAGGFWQRTINDERITFA